MLIGVLRRWAALVAAGLTEEQAWRETACTLPACGSGPGEAGAACCAHHHARRRAEALAWDVPASPAPTGEAARRGGTPPWRTPARDPGWALVDAALAAGARAGA
ncbi:secretion system protein F, partial [Micrococcus luteus]|nr:secretion system protein F [Micrococcus luteus]MBY0207611.1 secretion system protein F [Micrococcus luteus]